MASPWSRLTALLNSSIVPPGTREAPERGLFFPSPLPAMVPPMTYTPFLTRSQRAIARMVKDASGYALSCYSVNDRAVARTKLLAMVSKAPDHAPVSYPAKRTKAFFLTLADSMQDDIWRFL